MQTKSFSINTDSVSSVVGGATISGLPLIYGQINFSPFEETMSQSGCYDFLMNTVIMTDQVFEAG